MDSDRHIWRVWANHLHRWGISEWAADCIEATSAFAMLFAQVFYLIQPLIANSKLNFHLTVAAEMLERPEKVELFAAFLREESS